MTAALLLRDVRARDRRNMRHLRTRREERLRAATTRASSEREFARPRGSPGRRGWPAVTPGGRKRKHGAKAQPPLDDQPREGREALKESRAAANRAHAPRTAGKDRNR